MDHLSLDKHTTPQVDHNTPKLTSASDFHKESITDTKNLIENELTYLESTLYRSSEKENTCTNEINVQKGVLLEGDSNDVEELTHLINGNTEQDANIQHKIDCLQNHNTFISINDIQLQPRDTTNSLEYIHDTIPIRDSIELHPE